MGTHVEGERGKGGKGEPHFKKVNNTSVKQFKRLQSQQLHQMSYCFPSLFFPWGKESCIHAVVTAMKRDDSTTSFMYNICRENATHCGTYG